MSAAVVLLVYIVIGLLDSLHFHPALDEPDNQGNTVYSTEINSVLDLLLNDLRQNTERTYSAPLAAHAFAKEIIEQEDGTQVRDYPRLLYGGAYLNNPETERVPDILLRSFIGILMGVFIGSILLLLFVWLQAKRMQLNARNIFQRLIKNIIQP